MEVGLYRQATLEVIEGLLLQRIKLQLCFGYAVNHIPLRSISVAGTMRQLTASAIRYTLLHDTGGGLSGFACRAALTAASRSERPSLMRGANWIVPV